MSHKMTDAEMDRDVEDARTYLSVTKIRVDRCRHETHHFTTLWFFEVPRGKNSQGKPYAEQQIGCASRNLETTSDWKWDVTRMHKSQPVAKQSAKTLLDVIGNIVRYEPHYT